MKLTVNRAALAAELARVAGVVEKKPTIPVLANVRLHTRDGNLIIHGTDLDLMLIALVAAEIDTDGACLLPCKRVLEIARAADSDTLAFDLAEDGKVTIKAGKKSRFSMMSLPATDFPDLCVADGEPLTLPGPLVEQMIRHTAFAITQQESRYALNGAKFEAGDGHVRMIATDGHRLAFVERGVALPDGATIEVLIPRKAIALLPGLLGASVELRPSENILLFTSDGRTLATRLLTGQFPDYWLVLPENNEHRAVVAADELSAAVRRVGLMADERSRAITVAFASDNLTLSAQTPDGEATETLPAVYSGPEMTVSFNAAYLVDALGTVSGKDAVIRLKSPDSQVEIGCADGVGSRQIIMPMRI